MRWVRPLAALAGAGCLALSTTALAASNTTVQSGWWNEVAIGPLAGPTVTPANELQVSYGLKGPLAFAAVRIPLPSGTNSTSSIALRLAIPSGSKVGTPAVSACPTQGKWSPGADQKPSTAPGYSCLHNHQADGVISADDETWTVPASWASAGTISVALIPTQDTTVPFSIAYDQPTASSITVVAAPPPTTAPPVTAVATAPSMPASVPAPAGTTGAGAGSTPGGSPPAGGATVAPSGGPTVGAVSTGGLAPSLGAVPSAGGGGNTGATPVASGAPASAAPGGGAIPASATHGRAGRIMAFILLVGLGVALFALAAQPDRLPRLLGPMSAKGRMGGTPGSDETGPTPAFGAGSHLSGAPVPVTAPVRGIGRFARPRVAPPKRL